MQPGRKAGAEHGWRTALPHNRLLESSRDGEDLVAQRKLGRNLVKAPPARRVAPIDLLGKR